MLMATAAISGCSSDNITLENLTVEYCTTPLGIDVENPRFGWQMQVRDNARGYYQKAYQIVVKNPAGKAVWNSDTVNSGSAVAIKYAGSPLNPTTKYTWTVTVWDQNSEKHTASSWFETGLMNSDPDLTAWDGAQWIGGSDKDLVLYAQYLLIFRLKYSQAIAEGSTKAGFIFGANDMRLMDKNENINLIENKKNESYIKLELDISGLNGTVNGLAKLNIYRAGYTRDDDANKPIESFKIKLSVINSANKNNKHDFEISSAFGRLIISLDGNGDFFVKEPTYQPAIMPFESYSEADGASVNLNPCGLGGDYFPYGNLCDLGFTMDAGQKASFSNVEILNDRKPNATLFKEDLSGNYTGIYAGLVAIDNGAYRVDGRQNGTFVVADPSRNSTPMLRIGFETARKVNSARLYVTARGIYEVYINGHRVGNDHYNPGFSQYNKSHMYQTYDVTELIQRGRNAMGAMMAEGWWSGLLSFVPIWNHFGDRQSLLAKLVLGYEDGSKEIITTNDREWKYFNDGPIVYGSLDLGEIYDATKEAEIEGWSSPGFDDSGWANASVVPLEGTTFSGKERYLEESIAGIGFGEMRLMGQIGNNVGTFKTLSAKSVKEVRDGIFVYDMGQNFVGVPKISVSNGIAGDTMVLRVSEMLYPDLEESGDKAGMIMTENYRAALCKDMYIMKDGPQVFQPRFTSRGYQYIEISGLENPLPLEAVQGVAMSSVLNLTADYHTSNEKVNQLWSNLVWSNIGNFLSIPTDCPQRNERMGWSGDISVFSRTATYVSNSDQFFRRHMLAMRDVQEENGKFTDVAPVGGGFGGVLWGSAGITVAWEVYQQYKDIMLLEEHYDAMAAYMDYVETTIDKQTGITSDGALGDWLGPQNNQLGTSFLTSAYHVYDLWIMKRVAEVLGHQEDAARFGKMHERRKAYFNKTYINDEGLSMGFVGGPWEFFSSPGAAADYKVADTQSSYAVGLALGAFTDEIIPQMALNLAEAVRRRNTDDDGIVRPEYSLMTGFIGTAWISKALSENGYSDVAYLLLQNDQYPSWLYAIDQGATTIWERLNGYTLEKGFGGNNRMNSFNHYSFGAVGQWLMAHSLGIQRDEPGFQHFILQPEPDPTGEMIWAEGWYESMYGRIRSRWKYVNNRLVYEATVPANTKASLYLPAKSEQNIRENGLPAQESEGIEFLKFENGKAVFTLQSGKYRFVIK
ncbi:MAG: family 78 glycoside hydrolase catalytic domain [Bacteroidota bacterium]